MKKELNLDVMIQVADRVDEELYGPKNNEDLFKHLREEIDELEEKLNSNIGDAEMRFEQLKEFGDILFCITSIARQNRWDMVHALTLTVTKLQERIKFGIDE